VSARSSRLAWQVLPNWRSCPLLPKIHVSQLYEKWQNIVIVVLIMSVTVKIDSAGRVMIPAPLRKQLKLGEGSLLQIEAREGAIVLVSREEAIRRAQELFMNKCPERNLSEELLADRRAEAKRENRRER
jgi:AbrB family looped-hinge helix DNA binding protein